MALTDDDICGILAEVLGVPNLGLDVDFFEQGGHSLLAGRAVARIRRETGVRIRLAEFLDQPTARQLAMLVRQAHASDAAEEAALGGPA